MSDDRDEFLTLDHRVSETVSEENLALTCGSNDSDGSDTDAGMLEPTVIRGGAWLQRARFKPLRWAVAGLLPEGFALLVGPPKAGKSWLVLGLLLAVASGRKALGCIPAGPARPVLYLALEDGDRRMQARCRSLLGDREAIPESFHYVLEVEPGRLHELIEGFLEEHPDAAMVVIDTLGKVAPPAAMGESQYGKDYRVGTGFKRITADHPGLTLLVLHHDRKAAADDFVDSISGTHGLAGSSDSVLVLGRARQSKDGVLRVTGRDVPENSYALALDGIGHWRLDGADLEAAADKLIQREAAARQARFSETSSGIVDYVRQARREVPAKEIREKFGKNSDQYLKRRVEDGTLRKAGWGLYVVPDAVPQEPLSEPSEPQVGGQIDSDTLDAEVSECQNEVDR